MGKIRDRGREIVYTQKDFLKKLKSPKKQENCEIEPVEYRPMKEFDSQELHDLAKEAVESPNAEIEPREFEIEAHETSEENKTITTVEEIGRYFLNEEPAEAVVIYCGDPRFQKAFRDFLENELRLKNYVPIIIGGGIHPFGVRDLLPKNFKTLWEQIKFFLEDGQIPRLIVINHQDCQWYRKFEGYAHGIPIFQKGIIDLHAASQYLAKEFFNIKIETYMAKLKGKEIFFERI
jgi:hypothetical protein